MDGLPTACSRVLRAINNGQGDKVTMYGFATSVELSLFMASYASVTTTGSRYRLPPTTTYRDLSGKQYVAYGQPAQAGETAVQDVITPGFQLGFEPNPQNPGGPREIHTDPKNKNCSIGVSFEQGTFYDTHGELPNGPSALTGQFGLGFTVSGRVTGGGGIGKIGDTPNKENPKGKWEMYQLTGDEITALGGQYSWDWGLHTDLSDDSFHSADRNSPSFHGTTILTSPRPLPESQTTNARCGFRLVSRTEINFAV
jgi:hypothetical protein